MLDSGAAEGGLQGLWSRFLSLFNKGKDEVVRSSKVSMARLDLSSLKKERARVFERLGEEIYNRHKDKTISLSGFDSFFTEIDITNLKLSSKERELKGFSGEDAEVLKTKPAGRRPERRERPYRPRTRGPYPAKEVKQEAASSETKTERPESERRPKKRYYRPKKRPSEAKKEV